MKFLYLILKSKNVFHFFILFFLFILVIFSNIDKQSLLKSTEDSNYDLISNNVVKNEKVNINTADKNELMTINYIGEKLADNIIEYRKITEFKTIEDIKNVKGIKDKIFEKIKNFIYI